MSKSAGKELMAEKLMSVETRFQVEQAEALEISNSNGI